VRLTRRDGSPMDEPLPGNYDSPGEEWTGGATDGSPLFPDPPDMWSYSAEQVLATRRAQYPGTPIEYAGIEPARQVGLGGGLGRSNLGDGALARADARVADELNARFRPAVPVTLEEARRLRVRNQYQLDSTTEKVRGSLWGDAFATLLRYRVDGVGHHSGPPAPVQEALDSSPPRMFTPGVEHQDDDDLALVLTREQVCAVLGISKRKLIRLTADGTLDPAPGEDKGSRGGHPRYLYHRQWLNESRSALGKDY
jgi:hypothetical protein